MVLSLPIPGFTNRSPVRTRSATASSEPSKRLASPSTTSLSTTTSGSRSVPSSGTPAPNNNNSTLTEALRSNPFGTLSRTPKSVDAVVTSVADEKRRERQELNDALTRLAELFPDIKIEVFRELLVRFDGNSRLQICVEQLLKHRAEWVKGRWTVPSAATESTQRKISTTGADDNEVGYTDIQGPGQSAPVPEEETFRSDEYKNAVRTTLAAEFRAVSRSAIDGVLAEVNFSYTRARPTLRDVSRRSWRATFGNMFQFRKKRRKEQDEHPLLLWQNITDAEAVPQLKETGCLELDKELHEAFLAPLLAQRKEEQEDGDLKMAQELNEAEAKTAEALYECDCCLSDVTFEELSTCSAHSHNICFSCIQRTTHEALFGQGWTNSVNHERSTLRCLAPVSEGICEGHLDPLLVKRAIVTARAGLETYQKFETRLASESLLKSQLQLVFCPFCAYAEVDPIYHPTETGVTWRFRRGNLIPMIAMTVLLLDLIPLLIVPVLVLLVIAPSVLVSILSASLRNISLKTRNQRFTCANPSCRRQSCITCHKPWRDPHLCHEPLLLSLRTTVEAARTAAIKRTCPRCGLSFVKSSGCNKLTCVCGYSMCYVCRKALGPKSAADNNNIAPVQRQAQARPMGRQRRNNPHRNQENAPFMDAPFDGALGGGAEYDSDEDIEDDEEETEGYKHFCGHFRMNPGSKCTECTKCDLYIAEDEEAVARRAGDKAEREWRIREGLTSTSGTPGLGEVKVQLNDITAKRRNYSSRSGVPGPWDWNWQLDGKDWKGQWRFWMQDVWRDGRWKAEAQGLVDRLVESVVVVDDVQ